MLALASFPTRKRLFKLYNPLSACFSQPRIIKSLMDTISKFDFDLRSDILAPASDIVASAIAAAARRPGEFLWREDPIERALEHRVCEILGKSAAALFPTCTAANIAGLVALGARERALVLEDMCHLMTVEMAGLDWLSSPQVLSYSQQGGALDLTKCLGQSDAIFCLENTHNRRGGTVLNAQQTNAIAQQAKERGWSVFLDGSRLWNASVASGDSPAALASPVDLVSVSFNKGLGAPNGAALAGDERTIKSAVEAWRLLGGICRPSHVLAAGALAVLDDISLLGKDHALAQEAAAAVALLPGYSVTNPQTNIVLISGDKLGLDGAELCASLGRAGLGCLAFGPRHVRLVFHRGISADSAPMIADIFRKIASRERDD
ncbi:threonine aldolase family protein [Bradyrhizobium nitroreducens]|uniref:threonine aldolase family protein n=1 Tax=Bradyrhizobium nitroreducens TaxID=709803 RepID=UPI0011AEA476|nr:aminotransferase class I/II-fold pyridoxal phosphate-dependent enzyme [Bradyrhizobium nitroreducens]